MPLLRSGLNEHSPGSRAGAAKRLPESAYGVGIACNLNTKERIAVKLVAGRRVLERDLGEISIEFLGKIIEIAV